VSDIDAAMVVDSLKVLDPKRPIREADIRMKCAELPVQSDSLPFVPQSKACYYRAWYFSSLARVYPFGVCGERRKS
jgi:hypothetical protein